MEKLSDIAAKSPAYLKIANHAFPEGTIAKCLVCGKGRNVTTGEIAKWLRKGLPRHCGRYVELINPWVSR